MKTKNGNISSTTANHGKVARCELDAQANTTCSGMNCRPLFYTGQYCEAHGFNGKLSPISDVPIATVAMTWSNPLSGENFILINETLYFGSSLDHLLLNPNQLRHFGIKVFDNPYKNVKSQPMGNMLSETLTFPLTQLNNILHKLLPN